MKSLVSAGSMLWLIPWLGSAATLEVGPGKRYAAPCAAMNAAAAGDIIEVDPAGNYDGDVCVISKANLTVRGVGDRRAHIRAAGRNAQGKAIWVLSAAAPNFTVENIEFSGATVPDRNGAGIRTDTGVGVTVRNCHFHDNEIGILAANAPAADVTVEYSIFENNGFGDGQSHNIYVNSVRRFLFRGNYSTRCRRGHLVKSRAIESHILYNRLTQETGTGSFEIDIPNGGRTYIIGNLIQQGPTGENNNVIAYREEGRTALVPGEELFVINNTFVNEHTNPGGAFVLVQPGLATPVILRNNIFAGPGQIINQAGAIETNNFYGDAQFVNQFALNYHLQAQSGGIDIAADPGRAGEFSLLPMSQYRHPACNEVRLVRGALDAGGIESGAGGAFQGPPRCAATPPPGPGRHSLPSRLSMAPVFSPIVWRPARFANDLAPALVTASTLPLPRTLGSASVTVNGLPGPLYFASPDQVNFQIPSELEPGVAQIRLTVGNEHRPIVSFPLRASAPGIFVRGGSTRAVAQNQDYGVNGPSSGAAPGAAVIVYLTGQGAVSNAVPSGTASRAQPLSVARSRLRPPSAAMWRRSCSRV